jgi:hypothetical protein
MVSVPALSLKMWNKKEYRACTPLYLLKEKKTDIFPLVDNL